MHFFLDIRKKPRKQSAQAGSEMRSEPRNATQSTASAICTHAATCARQQVLTALSMKITHQGCESMQTCRTSPKPFWSDLLSPHSGSSETLVTSTRLQDLQYYLEQPWQISQQSVVTESQIMATAHSRRVHTAHCHAPRWSFVNLHAWDPKGHCATNWQPAAKIPPERQHGWKNIPKSGNQWQTSTLVRLANHNTLPSCSAASKWYPPLQWILNTFGREMCVWYTRNHTYANVMEEKCEVISVLN
jgi:hypothetical protein